jgi:hypothetical protein
MPHLQMQPSFTVPPRSPASINPQSAIRNQQSELTAQISRLREDADLVLALPPDEL